MKTKMSILKTLLALFILATTLSASRAQPYPFEMPTRLVFAGDSMSTGYGLPNPNINWPYYLTNTYCTWFTTGTNTCVPGYTVAQMTADYPRYVYPVRPDQHTNSILFVWCGVNDYLQTTNYIHDSLSNYWVRAKNDGFIVVACTITAASSLSPVQNQKMEAVNALIRQSQVWDYLLDGRQIVPSPYGTTTDGVHFTTNYHAVIARAAYQMLCNRFIGHNSDAPMMPGGNVGYVDRDGIYQAYVPISAPDFSNGYLLATVPFQNALPLTAATRNITSITLLPGDWLLSGYVNVTLSGAAGTTHFAMGITTTSAMLPNNGTESYASSALSGAGTIGTGANQMRFYVSYPTTVYLVASVSTASGSAFGWGNLSARRLR